MLNHFTGYYYKLYPIVSVPGRLPEVFFFDAAGKEVDKMYIEKLSFAGELLMTMVTVL